MKSSSLTTSTIALLWTLLFVTGALIHAQQSDHPRHSVTVDTDDLVTINTDLIITWAQMTNRKDGMPVQGLRIEDFALREDGQPQQLSLVKEGQPLSVVLLVDKLGCAVEPPEWSLPRIREALRQLSEDAEIAVMAWDADVLLVQPLTRDHNATADVIDKGNKILGFKVFEKVCKSKYTQDQDIYLPRPGEAVYQAARYLEKAASPGRRKIIIVLTIPQWINKTHWRTAAEVKELLDKTGVTIYGLYEEHRAWTNNYSGAAEFLQSNRKDKRRCSGGLLEEFVEQTGGAILVGRKQEESDGLFIKLAWQIRSSYTIGFYPANKNFGGRFRRLSLELSPAGKAKVNGPVNVTTRDGYRALRPTASASPRASVEP